MKPDFAQQLQRIRAVKQLQAEQFTQDRSFPFAQQLQTFLDTHFQDAYDVRLKFVSSHIRDMDDKSVFIFVHDRRTSEEITFVSYTAAGINVYKNADGNIAYAHHLMDRVMAYDGEQYRLQETLYYRPEEDQTQRDAAIFSYVLQSIESHVRHHKHFSLDEIGNIPGAHLGL